LSKRKALYRNYLVAKLDVDRQNIIKQGIYILFMKRFDTYALRPVSLFMGEHKLETFLYICKGKQ